MVFQVEPTLTNEEDEAPIGLVVGLVVVGIIISGLFGFVLRGYVKTSPNTGNDEVTSHTSEDNHISSSVLAVPESPDRVGREPSYERSVLKMLPEYKDQVRGHRPPEIRSPAQQRATAPLLPEFKDQVAQRPIRVDERTDQHERSGNSTQQDESSEKSFTCSGTVHEICEI